MSGMIRDCWHHMYIRDQSSWWLMTRAVASIARHSLIAKRVHRDNETRSYDDITYRIPSCPHYTLASLASGSFDQSPLWLAHAMSVCRTDTHYWCCNIYFESWQSIYTLLFSRIILHRMQKCHCKIFLSKRIY